jgi:hypothetical protein
MRLCTVDLYQSVLQEGPKILLPPCRLMSLRLDFSVIARGSLTCRSLSIKRRAALSSRKSFMLPDAS